MKLRGQRLSNTVMAERVRASRDHARHHACPVCGTVPAPVCACERVAVLAGRRVVKLYRGHAGSVVYA